MTHTHRFLNGKRIDLTQAERDELNRADAEEATRREMQKAAIRDKEARRAELLEKLGMSKDDLKLLIGR